MCRYYDLIFKINKSVHAYQKSRKCRGKMKEYRDKKSKYLYLRIYKKIYGGKILILSSR